MFTEVIQMVYLSSLPLPRQWAKHVKSSFLQEEISIKDERSI